MAASRHGGADAASQAIDARDEVIVPSHDHLRRRRRRWCADVGHEVGDGDVGLMANGGNRRDWTAGDRAGDDLFIEGPEILDRSTTAADDDDVHAADATDGG